jgi:ADP-ribose pyrophosphatase YjhB (NUDIX family)
MKDIRFCSFCGGPLCVKHLEGRDRLVCLVCQEIIYENPTPAACVVLLDDYQRLLLVRRSVEPRIGSWCLPGGFIEVGEHPEQAALRELQEETGLIGAIERLIGVRTNPAPIQRAVLLVCYLVTRYSGIPLPGDDASDIGFFPINDLPEIAFESHTRFIRDINQPDFSIV